MAIQFKATIKRKDSVFTLSRESTWNLLLSTLTEHFPKESPILLYYYNPEGLLVSLFDNEGFESLLSSDPKEVHLWSDPTDALSAKLPLSETNSKGQSYSPAADISSSIAIEKLGAIIDSYQPNLQDDSVISYAIGNLLTVLLKCPNSVDFTSFERWFKLVTMEHQKTGPFKNEISSSSSSSLNENETETNCPNICNLGTTSSEIPVQFECNSSTRHPNPSEPTHEHRHSCSNQKSGRHGKGHRGPLHHGRHHNKGDLRRGYTEFSRIPIQSFGKHNNSRHSRMENTGDHITANPRTQRCRKHSGKDIMSTKHSENGMKIKKHHKPSHGRSHSSIFGLDKTKSRAALCRNIAHFLRNRAALNKEHDRFQTHVSKDFPGTPFKFSTEDSSSDSSDTETPVHHHRHHYNREGHGRFGRHGRHGMHGGFGGPGMHGGFGGPGMHGGFGRLGMHGGFGGPGMHGGFGRLGMHGGFGRLGMHGGFGGPGMHGGFGGPEMHGIFGAHGMPSGFGDHRMFGGFGGHHIHHRQ